ncbi:hypothetical protein HPC49_24960 [Pyxidicoccus fallax]|uniref:Peptidase metallopeptidase domain-containing protein n=1 Tax=Pyxidicoccus fallax TaxID=394095 RepID=A0A848LSL7_9BACT|nr:matrixin family metalloprotease [Pyxidicoccus fallax]NMO20622.1 hypothetical protein [Pyxidicoccus fallax]NPC81465.1 hypothetical protein [Pyxidicoccus fallax]
MSWEEFLSRVHQEPDTGIYIANGDESFTDLKQLREFFEERIQQRPVDEARSGLAVMLRNGTRARWSDAEKFNLTYCVSTTFGSRHGTVVAAMADAARAWSSAAGVGFVHRAEFDGNCNAAQNGVLFDVRPVSGGAYLARAFFPGDARASRNVLIDGTAFTSSTPNLTLTGILRHELGHTLGFRHEHTRPQAGTCLEDNNWEALTGYDSGSVMHYPQCNGTGNWSLVLTALDIQGAQALYGLPLGAYLTGDWNGDGRDNLAVRRNHCVSMDTNFDGTADIQQCYGNGDSDHYLVGDWNGDGRGNLAVRRGHCVYMDTNFDGAPEIQQCFGNGDSDHYLVGDWDGDGRDNLAVRRGLCVYMDTNFDGAPEIQQCYGNGDSDHYLVGDWDGDGRDNLAVRRGLCVYMDTNFDGAPEIQQCFGNGDSDHYLVGDWNGDGRDNLAVRRGQCVSMDTNFDGISEIRQCFQ